MDGSENRDCGLFTVLFEQYREPFTRFANSFVRDRAVSENLFVDALVDDTGSGAVRCPKIRTSRPVCRTSVRNKALNHLRHQRIRERVVRRADAPCPQRTGLPYLLARRFHHAVALFVRDS